MRLRLRHLRLIAETVGTTYGRSLSFAEGLNVIRADNTCGKSTLMQSIIYALGLEGMIDSRHEIPLPPAMTDSLRDQQGNERSVHESFVMLEIENERGERLTCQRWVRHERMDRHLIRTWRGGALSDPSGTFEQSDYFVRRSGAAQRDRGFHYMLAQFLGWQLPMIQRDEGDEVPLYLEMMFPLFYVEQKRGWGGIQATMPTYGVPNARRRALEFVLDLGVYRRARERNTLLAEMERLRSAYRQGLSRFRGRLQGTAVVLQGLDADVPTRWPEVEPRLMVAVAEDRWIALAEHLRDLRAQHQVVVERQVPTAEQASRELEQRLQADERALERFSAAASELHDRQVLDEDQIESLTRRTQALEEDRRRYQDALTLQRLGANETTAILEGDECPACHRPLPAALVIPEFPLQCRSNRTLSLLGNKSGRSV